MALPDHHIDPSMPTPATLTLFWRPACGFCASLRRQLAGTGLPISEVDIWEHAEGAATVRRFAGGNETVPTLVIGDPDASHAVGLVNPSAREVLDAIAQHAPELLEPDTSA